MLAWKWLTYCSSYNRQMHNAAQPEDVFWLLQVVRLAKKLPQGDVRQLAASLGSQQSVVVEDHDEEDLT